MQILSAAKPDVPSLSAPADPARFVQVVGERMALLGRESGVFECWMWPLELCRDLCLELFYPGVEEPIGELEREVEVTPGELAIALRGKGFELRWQLFASRERRGAVMLFELDGDGPLEVELAFRCVLRPMWPAGLGGQIGVRDAETGAFLLTEELGRFAALLGGSGFDISGGGLDHALPEEPVRLRATLEPASTRVLVIAGAQLDPGPLSAEARLGRGQAAVGLSRAQEVAGAARELWSELTEGWSAERQSLREHWSGFLANTTTLESSEPAFDEAFRWAAVAIERAWARVDGLGRGLLAGLAPSAGSGRPGYGWFFDGDALIASRAMISVGDFSGAREVLRFAASHQRADGKLMHELTLSATLCDWLEDYPYAYYKGLNAADFAISLERYVRASGDLDLARELTGNLKRAIRWCAGCADAAGRLRTAKAGIAAVEAGPLSDFIESDVFLQGAWMGALEAAQRLAVDLGEEVLAAWASDLLDQAREGFEGFASPHGGYGFALLEGGQRADDSNAFLGYPLALGFGEPGRALAATAALNHPRLCADWGVRLFATDSAVYDPGDYNTGAVFPYLTGFAGLALFRHGLAPAAHQVLGSLVGLTGFGSLGLIEEHLLGDRAESPARGVPHQIFSSYAVPELILAGLFGLEPDAVAGSLSIAPCLPPHWERAALRGLRVGETTLDLEISRERREGETLTHIDLTRRAGPPLKVAVAPLLPPLSRVRLAGVDGSRDTIEPRVEPSGALRVPFEEHLLERRLVYALTAAEGPEPSFPSGSLERGQVSRHPRPIDQRVDGDSVTWSIAGLAGSPLEVSFHSDLPYDLHASDRFPDAAPGTFTSIELTARLRAEIPLIRPMEHQRTHILAQIGCMAHQPLDGFGIATATLSEVRTPGEPEHGCRISAWSPRAEDGAEPPTPSPVLAREPELEFLREWSEAERGLFEYDGDTLRAQLRFESESSCYGTGEVAGPLLRNGRATILWNADSWCYSDESASLYQSHPHVLVLRPDGSALGILADTPSRGRIETAADGVELQFEGGPFRLFLIEGPGPAAVQRALAALCGRIELPPLWALGYHQCRWSYEDQAEVRALARGFAERGIPLDAIWFDIDYMDRYRVFTWNRERFGDPRGLVEELHAEGLRAVAIVDPGLALAEDYEVVREAREGGHLVLNRGGQPTVGRVWPGLCHFPDFSAEPARRWWSERIRAFLEETPLDGIWNDMNEPSLFRTPTRTLPETARHGGDGPDGPDSHARYHNLYGQQMAQATHTGVRAARPEQRPFVLTRSNHISGSRFSATWTGDNQATWQDLRWSISMALSLGLSGQPFAGPDVGGFHGDPSPELFVRWFELGAHLPFFRGHSDKDSCRKEPWAFGAETEALVRAVIERRMRLLPTLYTLFRVAAEEGLPVVRPLFWADPADPQLRAVDDQFLLGNDLLIAPVVEPGVTRREVLLPDVPGGWYPLEGGPALLARRVSVDAPLGSTPRFARAGSILVETESAPRARPGGDLVLHAFLDPSGHATGRLYEDEGEGYGYLHGEFLDRKLRLHIAEGRPGLDVESDGTWPPPARRRRLVVRGAAGADGPIEMDAPDELR